MLQIKDIVNVIINREVTSKTVRDLNKIAVLSSHDHYSEDEVYRTYGSTTEMLDDGFQTSDYAYVAAMRIFSQNPQVREVVVGGIKPEVGVAVDYVAEITKLQSATEEWFFIITDASDNADKEKIADYIETQTAVYILSDSSDAAKTIATTDIFSKIQAKGLQKTFGMYEPDVTVIAPEAGWVGRFASAVIGSNAWIHKAITTLIPAKLTRTEMNYLKSKNAHFYTLVGKDPSLEGNANTLGGEKIHVILGAIWLEVRLAERLWNLLYSKERINYTNAGIELFKAEIVTVLNEGVTNNILTADDGFNIQVPDANKLTSQERASGYLRKITFRVRLAGAILFVDAVQGTVYS